MRKLCEGMDVLTLEEKERCLSFAEAINAIEGLTISTELEQQLKKWKNGEITFYQVFESILKRYGFSNMRSKIDTQ
ncbi:MAG: antitoxin VbhA family protein [Clostridia bacterium]|nr:antitoxin VbhA family protein [Clostridia bacterium]